MSNLHDAIRFLNPSVITINNITAYDAQGNEVFYDKSAAEVKLAELQAAETAKQEAEATAKASALSKLTALGLTADEVKALLGTA